jgi:rhamnose utilization protein RhaD (predicted bifunctional aldolase and dehydrogenase)/NAD(P)-dependent dehydrogenase (short-subunit alcohol dehydrogenase family)
VPDASRRNIGSQQGKWGAVSDPSSALDDCARCSRLIGADPALVLHGGGNSSVKTTWRDITGRELEALFVKASGFEMATIGPEGFAPLALRRLHELLELESLSDAEMVRELTAAKLDPDAPAPSVETLLHAFLPFPAVLHSHADAIVTLTNLSNGEEIVRQVLGDAVVVVPYVMPGFELAREVRRVWPEQARPESRGMVLLNHGLVTFGAKSREAYERHVELLASAEEWLQEHAPAPSDEPPQLPQGPATELAELRRLVSEAAGRALVLRRHTGAAVRRFVARPDLVSLTRRGPLTPDHVIRTKPAPLVGRDVTAFADSYSAYFAKHAPHARAHITMLDPAPRVILDPELGMLTAGPSAHEAQVVADIYHHTISVLERAEDHLGGYVGLPPERLFEVEYWELEQAKLRRAGESSVLAGTVAVVTGAASGIGRACAEALLAHGVAVAGLDISHEVESRFAGPAWKGIVADVTDAKAVGAAVRTTAEAFGGVDIAVISAGIFGPSTPIVELGDESWRSVLSVNVDSALRVLRDLHPLLARSPVGGRVVVIGSKNVAAPGRGVAPYSASKAALTQLGRVAALEWADDGIRVNVVHPDAVFDTRLWTPEMLAERARQYGVDVETYRRRNLLRTEIKSEDVARAVVALCDNTFRVTTGAQIPIDGGNERVI